MSTSRRDNIRRRKSIRDTNSYAIETQRAGSSSISQPWPAELDVVNWNRREDHDSSSRLGMQQGSLNETILLNALRDDDHTTSLEEHVGTFNMEPVYKDVQSSSKGEAHESQATEIHRLRLEVSALKAQTERIVQSEALRTKKMRELKRKSEVDAVTSTELLKEMEKIKSTHDKLKEHLQCQICLELLRSPWTLSPCGHVGCFECLVAWFKEPDLENEEDDEPTPIIYKKKTCPQCRALIMLPPTRSYILKSLVDEIQPTTSPVHTSIETDPWKGVFAPIHKRHEINSEGTEDHQSEDDEGNSDEDDYDEDEDEQEEGLDYSSASRDSTSDYSEYRGEIQARSDHLDQVMAWEMEMRNEASAWTDPVWQPPRFDFGEFHLSPADLTRLSFLPHAEILSLLRRGATKNMIATYRLSYKHRYGIVAYLETSFRIRLGWNISRSSDDPDGTVYMEAVLGELRGHPERFRLEAGPRVIATIIRLVPTRGGLDDNEIL